MIRYVFSSPSPLTAISKRLTQFQLGQNQNQSYLATDGLPPINSSWRQAPWGSGQRFHFQRNTCGYSPHATSSLMRGWVCHLQLLLSLASAVILGSESRGARNHILLFQFRDSPNLEGQVAIFVSPRNNVDQLYPQALGSLVVSYDSQGYYGGIQSQSHIATDDQSVLVSSPHLGLMTRYLLLFDSYGLVFVGRPLFCQGHLLQY
jgi:hypothetical protein